RKISRIKSSIFIYLILLFSALQNVERFITVIVLEGERMFGDYYATTSLLTVSIFLVALKNTTFGKNSFMTKIGENAVGVCVSHLFVVSVAVYFLNFIGLGFVRNNVLFILIFALAICIDRKSTRLNSSHVSISY